MGYTSDVQSTRVTESGVIFGGRTRVKAIYVVPGALAGTVQIRDGGSGGTVVATIDTKASSDSSYLVLPEDGLLCSNGSFVTLTNVTAATVFYA